MDDGDDHSRSASHSPSPRRHPAALSSPVTIAAPPHQTLTLALPVQTPRPGGAGREDFWSDGATSALIDAWGERFLELSGGHIQQKQWQEVADAVSSREDYTKPPKTDLQCKNRIDTLKKKYKIDGATPKPPENPAAERPSKCKMKSPFQLEVLEKTYAAETYPSEALRAELSQKIGLTDRQLQMWFCHRRLKDRKCPVPGKRARMDEDSPPPPALPALPALPAPPLHDAMASPMGSSSGGYEARRAVGRVAVLRIRSDVGLVGVKHYYDAPAMMLAQPMVLQLSAPELRVIASVEQQLREPLREDGPILGVEFEPLPPGAFGAPIVTGQQKQPMRPYDDKLYGRHGTKMFKASTLFPGTPSFRKEKLVQDGYRK